MINMSVRTHGIKQRFSSNIVFSILCYHSIPVNLHTGPFKKKRKKKKVLRILKVRYIDIGCFHFTYNWRSEFWVIKFDDLMPLQWPLVHEEKTATRAQWQHFYWAVSSGAVWLSEHHCCLAVNSYKRLLPFSLEPRTALFKRKDALIALKFLFLFFLYIKLFPFFLKIRDCIYYVTWVHLCIVMPVDQGCITKKSVLTLGWGERCHIHRIRKHDVNVDSFSLRHTRPRPYWLIDWCRQAAWAMAF